MAIKHWLLLPALTLLAAGRLAPATVFAVNSGQDLPDANLGDPACAAAAPGNPCTLRAAVMQANSHAGPDFISLPAGTYTLTLSGQDDTASLGDLDVSGDLTVLGGPGVVINANHIDRIFDVLTGTLSLENVVLENGSTTGRGGAIQALGDVNLLDSVVQNNTAAQDGGGIYMLGAALNIDSSQLRGNNSQTGGGGAVSVFGSLTQTAAYRVAGSTLANNFALGGEGGGVYSYDADANIQDSQIETNTAASGGGAIYYVATIGGPRFSMGNSRVISNTANGSEGGGLYLYGQTIITHSQILSNTAMGGGGGVFDYYGTHVQDDDQISYNVATSSACGGLQSLNGIALLNRGEVSYNRAADVGGGLCSSGAGTIYLAITDTVVFKNTADQGAGAFVVNEFRVWGSALYDNVANTGGGVYASGPVEIVNSTLSNNFARHDGGGIYAAPGSTVQLRSATLADNQAHSGLGPGGVGGGVYISITAVVSAANTLLGLNTNSSILVSYSDCFGALRSEAYNFVSTKSGCAISGDPTGNQVGGIFPLSINPQIEPLSWLGGPTPGHLPLAGSPLISAAAPGGCLDTAGGLLLSDQIGHDRALGGRCDIGAIERFDIQRLYLALVRR